MYFEERKLLIELQDVSKTFLRENGQPLDALSRIKFRMWENEIVVLLGKSGSGKSTLLRVMAGLIPPTEGQAIYRGQILREPVPGIAMVFQSFALLPWLTVLENVALGLEAQGVKKREREARAIEAIDLIGLDGFENAYPRELSGGMRQRVGFARALVVEPELLLMDEPFSALDVLTSDNLRSDLIDLWDSKKSKIKGIVMVTHNIEEGLLLADRIVIMDSNPGKIRAELQVDLSRPRSVQDARFGALMDRVYMLMASKHSTEMFARTRTSRSHELALKIPDVDVSELLGLLETLLSEEYNGIAELSELADFLSLDVDELFLYTEVLELLDFARVRGAKIEASEYGRIFHEADILQRKNIFSEQLLKHLPLVRKLYEDLNNHPEKRKSKEECLDALYDHFGEQDASEILSILIEWCRYAEIFSYDDKSQMIFLEHSDDQNINQS